MRTIGVLFLGIVAAVGCGSNSAVGGSGGVGGQAAGGAGAGSGGASAGGASGVTFWQDVAPIFNEKCVPCHQEGGLGPFRLDNFPDAHANAGGALAETAANLMPPYFMVHDDSCGAFQDEKALTAAQKATIAAWVNGGATEGTPVTLTPPAKPVLPGAVDVMTPVFAPVAQGGQLAENDEYRCFALDAPNTKDAFVTGYDISPGEPSIVHHVIVFVVDPAAKSGTATNAVVMKALDDASPDRSGWPCFGGAGDNLKVDSIPVTWAPGQGVVSYPDGMGVPLPATRKLIVQVHYNLVDPASVGKIDQTTVHLRFADKVERKLAFLLPDPFLDSLGKTTPDSLPPGQADAKYTWTKTAQQIGLSGVPSAELVAVMPHMHGRGLRQTMTLGGTTCASHLEGWDFHWQEFYFYKTRPTLMPTTQIQVTCEYDTSNDTAPVLPGWGTHNEMCLNVLMIALPAGS